MQLKGNSIVKRIIAILSVVAIVVGVSAGVSTYMVHKEVARVQDKLVVKIKGDLGEYLGEYQGISTGISGTLTADKSGSEAVELTEDQINSIVSAVSGSIEYDLIKDTISSYSNVSEESLAALKNSMTEKIHTILNENPNTASLSEEEKRSMEEVISTIVKSDLLSAVSDYSASNDKDIAVLQQSIEKDIDSLNKIIDSYDSKFESLKSEIADLTSDSVDKDEVLNIKDDLNDKLNDLTSEYKSLVLEVDTINNDSLTTTDIVNNLYTDDNTKALSAAQGAALKKLIDNNVAAIEKNTSNLNGLISALNSSFDSINASLENAQNSTGQVVSDLEALSTTLSQTKDILSNQQSESNEKIEALTEAKNLIQQNLATASEDTQTKLTSLSTEMDNQIQALRAGNEANTSELIGKIDSAKGALESDISSNSAAIAQNSAAISTNSANIAALQSTLNTFNTELTGIKNSVTTLQGTIATLNSLVKDSQMGNEKLDERVTSLESGLAALTNQIGDETGGLVKRIKVLENTIGNTSISSIGDGTVTGALSELNSNIVEFKVSFRDGCNTIVQAVTAAGQTPADNSPGAISDAILKIYSDAFADGVSSASGSNADIEYEYHSHTGNATDGGGCYTIPVYKKHSHTGSCYSYCSGTKRFDHQEDANRTGAYINVYYKCDRCGKITLDYSWIHNDDDYPSTNGTCGATTLICGKTAGIRYENEGIDYYEPGCGYRENELIAAKIIFRK